jgi:hypothetical protein
MAVSPGGRPMDTSPFSSSTTDNWVARTGGLNSYIRGVSHALLRTGRAKDEATAIRLAVAAIKRWAAGGDHVRPQVQAAAAAALADWEAKRAASHAHSNDQEAVELAGAFNAALHPRVAAGASNGGQFGSAAASASKPAAKPAKGKPAPAGKPPAKPMAKTAPKPAVSAATLKANRAKAAKLHAQAKADRTKAHALLKQIAGINTQIKANQAAAAKAAAAAKTKAKAAGTAAGKAVAKKAPSKTAKKSTTKKAAKKVTTAQLKTKRTQLRTKAASLMTQAKALDAQASHLKLASDGPAVELAVKTPAPERAAGRAKLAASDDALDDGSFPIPDLAYLKKAIRSVGRAPASRRPALKALIRKRARELNAMDEPGVKGTWAFEGANGGEAIELAYRYKHGWIKVGGAADEHIAKAKQADAEGRHADAINHLGNALQHVTDKSAAHHLSELKKEMAAKAMGVPYKAKPLPKRLHAMANDGGGIELAMMMKTARVRGPGDVSCKRTGPGEVTVTHKPTGMRIGTLKSAQHGGWAGTHATGKPSPASGSMAGALSGLIGVHNKVAASMPSAEPAGSVHAMAAHEAAMELAGALPYTSAATSSDGPRVTTMGGSGGATSIKTATGKTVSAAGGVSAEVQKVYRKLIAKGMKPAQAMALAKRAASMHAKATAKAA